MKRPYVRPATDWSDEVLREWADQVRTRPRESVLVTPGGAMPQRLGISLDKAEAAKQGHEVGVNWDDMVPALGAVSRDLSLEVQRTFDYFASTAESERISKIILSGGCAKLTGIQDFLASSWGVPVEIARPFAALERTPGQFNEEELAEVGPLFAVAVGLALRRPGDKN